VGNGGHETSIDARPDGLKLVLSDSVGNSVQHPRPIWAVPCAVARPTTTSWRGTGTAPRFLLSNKQKTAACFGAIKPTMPDNTCLAGWIVYTQKAHETPKGSFFSPGCDPPAGLLLCV
jgi:hypothetical protein